MQIACVLYERFTMLDIVGPFQVFSSLPGTTVDWVATETGPVTDHTGFGQINATAGNAAEQAADNVPLQSKQEEEM